MMALLKDKVVIVTGSSSGIGLATLQNALEEGAKVVGVDITLPPQSFSAQVAENYHFLQADLTNPDAPSQVVAKALGAYGGRIDALFNIAGVMDDNSSVENVTDEMWDRCIAINLTAPVMLMREVVKVMKEQKSGSIVNVASKAGMSGGAAGVAYTASKHGLVGATKNVAWRFKADGIRCNAVLPGAVLTGISKSVDMSKMDREGSAAIGPIIGAHMAGASGLPMTPEAVAPSLIYLASDKAAFISGALLPIDMAWSTI